MSVDIKFCGLMQPADAEYAAELGAAFVGVIFAGGPRRLEPSRAAAVLAHVPASVKRVGVFADQRADEIARIAGEAGLDVVQLHGASDPARIAELRRRFGGHIWPVARVANGVMPPALRTTGALGDALLLDSYVAGTLGGTGVALPWARLVSEFREVRAVLGARALILAGGLTPENVAEAIGALAPDVVDVSSGVEAAPGVKDHARMRAFRDAVLHATISA